MSAKTAVAEASLPNVRVAEGMASSRSWCPMDEEGNFQLKVLSLDWERKSVEALFKVKGGYRSGAHKHTCETHVFIVSGKVQNHTIGCTFTEGDYCYQPFDDVHDEEFVEDTIAYVSYRGKSDTMVEFLDSNGEVCGEFKLNDFENAMSV